MLYLATLFFFSSKLAVANTILFEEDNRLPLVHINVVLNHGSTTDPNGKEGLVNLTGEMLLTGTTHKSKSELDDAIDHLGARFYVDTRGEFIIFQSAVTRKNLKPFLSLFREILTQPKFSVAELTKLKKIINNALLNSMNSDASIASIAKKKFLFGSHPYAKETIGKIKDLKSISIEDIKSNYKLHFQRSNVSIFGSGDAPQQLIQKWANQVLSELPQEKIKFKEMKEPQFSKKRKIILVDKPDRTQSKVILTQEGIELTPSTYFPLMIGNHAFGGNSFSSRLFKEIRVKRGWSYGARSGFTYAKHKHSWSVHLAPKNQDTARAIRYSIQLIRELKEQGIKEEEFKFSKESLINSDGFRYDTATKRIYNRIYESVLSLPNGFEETYAKELERLDLNAINKNLRTFLKPEQIQIVIVGTAKILKPRILTELGVKESELKVVPYQSLF